MIMPSNSIIYPPLTVKGGEIIEFDGTMNGDRLEVKRNGKDREGT